MFFWAIWPLRCGLRPPISIILVYPPVPVSSDIRIGRHLVILGLADHYCVNPIRGALDGWLSSSSKSLFNLEAPSPFDSPPCAA